MDKDELLVKEIYLEVLYRLEFWEQVKGPRIPLEDRSIPVQNNFKGFAMVVKQLVEKHK